MGASLGVHVSLLYPLAHSRLGRRSLEAREITRGDHAARDTGYPYVVFSARGRSTQTRFAILDAARALTDSHACRGCILIELGSKARRPGSRYFVKYYILC